MLTTTEASTVKDDMQEQGALAYSVHTLDTISMLTTRRASRIQDDTQEQPRALNDCTHISHLSMFTKRRRASRMQGDMREQQRARFRAKIAGGDDAPCHAITSCSAFFVLHPVHQGIGWEGSCQEEASSHVHTYAAP